MRVSPQIPPGLVGDDTTYAASGRYADGSNVRFWRGRAQVIGGWEKLVSTALSGTCRKIFGWMDNSAVLNLAFGTHATLELWTGGALYNITPYGPPTRLGANPLTTTNLSTTVVVAHTAHGYANGITVKVAGAPALNGIDAANLNGDRVITVINANSYSFTAGAADAASSSGSGGGATLIVTPQTVLTSGSVNGTGGQGYGTGAYSTGTYSSPSTADYFPRTWSLSAWGQNLIASPRAGAIYLWQNSTGTRAVANTNAPVRCTHVLVAPTRQVFALGCDDDTSPYDFDPLVIRHCAIEDLDNWTASSTSTAGRYRLPGGGRIVSGAVVGNNLLVWTSNALFVGTYVGDPTQIWRFDQVGEECGLIGPNAAVVVGQKAFWIGPNKQIYGYVLGSQPQIMDCPIQVDFADNLTASQFDKIVASSNSAFDEIRFDYPDARDGSENSRYLAAHVPTLLNDPEGAWYRGQMARTAFVDAPPSPNSYPVATDADGAIYWHEKGNSADGSAFSWFLEAADSYLDPNVVMQVRQVWPDFKDQIGPITITLTTRFYPQGDETVATGQAMGVGDDKTDLRSTGRLARVKYSGNASPTYARIGNPTFDVVPSGQR